MSAQPIELTHLQLTMNCNLRCPFCGQWGRQGFMETDSPAARELDESEWLDAIAQIEAINASAGVKGSYILWGGEPLLSPAFPAVAGELKRRACPAAVVTNGLLLSSFAERINETLSTVYLSLDGPEALHDRIRNHPGLHGKVREGLAKLDRTRVKVVNLFTLCEANLPAAADYPAYAAGLGVDAVVFQNLIYCTSGQAQSYREWLSADFGQTATNVSSWVNDSFGTWVSAVTPVSREIRRRIRQKEYPVDVTLYPAELPDENAGVWYDPAAQLTAPGHGCFLPQRHIHIRPTGSVDFCVDHNDFSLGNIRQRKLQDLLESEAAQRFREGVAAGKNPLCARCPWHYNRAPGVG